MELLIVDDDKVLRERLYKTLSKRGFEITLAGSVQEALELINTIKFSHALIDLKLEDGFGLTLIDLLKKNQPNTRIVVLTGYGNIASAVTAIKHGAFDYIPKPCDSQTLYEVLMGEKDLKDSDSNEVMSVDRIKWEHIQRVLLENNHNISQTARALQMHRRTLQRILSKHAPHT